MMKLKYLFDNRDLAMMLLKCWEYDPDELDLMNHFRISANAVYPFKAHGEVRILRFAPSAEKRAQDVAAELEFIQYLNRCGYPALKPVPAINGRALVEADTPWGGYLAAVFDRVPGESLENTPLMPEVALRYGAALGRLHALSTGYRPGLKRWSHEDVLNWCEFELEMLGGQRCALEETQWLRARLSELPREHYGLIHYDFELDNVFYNPETASCHAIDFDDCMYHWFVMDVEQAMDSLAEEAGEDAQRAFLDGYLSEYPLPAAMLALRPLMRRFAALYGYVRVARSVRERWHNEPDWMVGLRGHLDGFIARRSEHFGQPL